MTALVLAMCLFVVERNKGVPKGEGAGRSIWWPRQGGHKIETQGHVIRMLLIVVCVLFVCLLDALLGGGRYLLPSMKA